MTRGLVLGKFYPLHVGHISLIEFSVTKCDELIILICASDRETIPGEIRLQWIQETFINNSNITPTLLNYSEQDLPNTSVSSKRVSQVWATKIQEILPSLDLVFSSEAYGDFLAEFLHCRHISFDGGRLMHKISSTDIRKNAFKYWDYIAPAAKPSFVKKVCIYGTESTGKSTLTKNLAAHYKTDFVPEVAREVINATDECTPQHLIVVATMQAKEIRSKIRTANKILFVDTDVNITRSYSKFLFGKELEVPVWIEELNQFDLYLYLDIDAPYVQDGTRLEKNRRDELNAFHKKQLADRSIEFELVTGDWTDRFERAVSIINKLWG